MEEELDQSQQDKFKIEYWECLECKAKFSTKIIEENMKCPNCECIYFNVRFEY